MTPTDTATAPRNSRVRPTRGQVARTWSKHLLSLLFPLNALVFSLTGPHRWYVALAFVVPILASVVLDARSGQELREPADDMPSWPFDALLLVLTALQVINVVLLARMFASQSLLSFDTLAAAFVVGSSSGYSGIVVGHELIHRTHPVMRQLGRLLMCTVLYEHFATEHVYGHHVRVGLPQDPATARYGEAFLPFFRRTVPAQFKSAWRIESKRLGDERMRWYDPRQLRNRVLHGLVVGWGLAAALGLLFGVGAFVVHVLQAGFAIRLLETVNYFEHWGITRKSRNVQPEHSWDTTSAWTYYSLTGLSRHADHHAFASRPYQKLRLHPETPRLPRGYLAMFPLVWANNRRFRTLMSEELQRRGLGPFAGEREAA